ncbi:thiol reductant ABC exporter subunit CydC [Loktanella sp. D2R18]|uniref:thiol reductant ABC exporter subunit CydC n=1 Tax=Rhodobacterales TaxID=204455 RepID=UPI000DEA88B4|nr:MULTISPECIES: thiol reductant ABC exporter subunit CydC [Rhodobacterales]MDO6592150.1 thiol reductant ABC exporter subunit CydC [Yoonia sp. 1_MG-2023]RBW45535.1 thiol reductant ABC exporter subunit CydC [Loktanella sp. D2R18]
MTALWTIFKLILRAQPAALWRGAVLGFVVLVMGAALLGLSGWFITAAAAAGLAGVGAVFDVFRPSAMVRFLALGRAAARYGERILTHDATLRALEVLRMRLLAGLMVAPYPRMVRIRGAQALNRLTADVDALDGVSLRLVLPVIAGLVTQMLAFVMLWWLVSLPIALWIFAGYVVGALVIGWKATHKTARLSRRAEAAGQAFRARLIDMIHARRDLAVHGHLTVQADDVDDADTRRLALQTQQEQFGRVSGAAFSILGAVVAGGTLWIGIAAVQGGAIAPAFAALSFFAALALAETVAPLRRAASDYGRMAEAARRVARDVATPLPETGVAKETTGVLQVDAVCLTRPQSDALIFNDLSLNIQMGETVALTGKSGAGKSTLLLAIAGLHLVAQGQIKIGDLRVTDMDEASLRNHVTLLPQRSVLMRGTVREALCLVAPDCDDAALCRVLEAVQLRALLDQREGLDTMVGTHGDALSGGEARRLTLARALLRRPDLLLLDEPTEGLDEKTGRAVLQGIRSALPNAAILIAAHRDIETQFADRTFALQ